MGKKKEPISEPELQRQHERFLKIIELVRQLGLASLVALSILGFAYFAFYLPITAAAGQTTIITQTQNLAASLQANVVVAWSVAGAAGFYGWRLRRKLLTERAEKDARIAELEKQLDPNRTSSGLTPEGEEAPGKDGGQP